MTESALSARIKRFPEKPMLRPLGGPFLVLVTLAACSASVSVRIDPVTATVLHGGATQFHAVVTGDSTGGWWHVQEGAAGGSVDAKGTYSAPAAIGTFHVVAMSKVNSARTATATVTVVADAVVSGTVQLTSTLPVSPANENAPVVNGTGEPGTTVKVFGTADCGGTELGRGVVGGDGTFAVHVTVLDNTTTAFHASSTALDGTVSACSANTLTYVEDSTAPAAPTLVRVLPGATGSDHSPRFIGAAEAESHVTLHSDPACMTSLAEGSAADFASAGITVTVADGASLTVYATATDAARNVSACSTTSLTYRQDNGVIQPPTGWNGPTARIESLPGTNETFLNIDGQRYRPVFVSVNPQAIADPAGWKPLLAEIDLASEQGMPIVDLMLANRSVSFLHELSQQLGSRQVYLWLRFDIWIPELATAGVPLLQSLAGVSQPGYRETYALSRDAVWSKIPFYSALDQAWLDAEKQSLTALLGDINQSGIGARVIGVRTTYMAGGEWFQPPLAFHDNTVDEAPPNAWPWSNPDAFSVGDYSSAEQTAFSQWLPTAGYAASLPFPTPADRINPRLGRGFVIGNDGSGLSAALYHRFASERVATLQSELAKTAKQVTESKALVMINNGYLFSLAHYNGSLHTALENVLNSPSIDAISAPYNYNTLGSRRPGFALIPHGPMDSPALHGKLWIHEDDSRPYWSTDGFRTTTSAAEDTAMLLRNAITSLIHGNALYFFDLPNQGWFGGNPQHVDETRSVYATLQSLKGKLAGQLSKSGPVQPEIAIFIDDTSSHLYPEFGMDGAATYGTSNDLILRMVEKISLAGAPIRYYLLDDLGNPNLDVSALKLVFFLNTPKLTQAQRQQVQSRLMNNGRVLYFQYVSGLFDESLMPAWSLASPYSPGVSSLTDIEASTSTAVTLSDQGSYVIAYSPRGADQAGIDALVDRATVHRYARGAVIDGAGSILMVHSTGGAVPVAFTSAFRVVDMLAGTDVCSSCSSLTLNLASPETRVYNLLTPLPTPGRGRLFRYEFTPGSVGGAITHDEQTYCGLPDGATLIACGFTGQDYANAPITPYGRLTLVGSGACVCP
jgi:hypothetical protein